MKQLEDKGFIDQDQWERVLSEQNSQEQPELVDPAVVHQPRRFWPWAFSITLHVLLVLLAGVWVWREPLQTQRQPMIPTARLSAMPGGAVFDQQTQLTESLPKLDVNELMEPTFEQLPGFSPAGLVANDALLLPSPSPVTLVTPAASVSVVKPGVRSNPFAGLMPGSLEPTAAFFGVAGNAQTVVYVVDASGSLVDTLPYVLAELRRSILRLSAEQQFSVLFFQGNSVLQIPPAGLRQATFVNQQHAVQWIDPDAGHLFAKGKSNPLPALKEALGYEPDLLFLLTDNLATQQTHLRDDQTLLREIAKANIAHTAIHTIQFLYRDQTAPAPAPGTGTPAPGTPAPGTPAPGTPAPGTSESTPVPLLKRLAQQQGGQYTFIDAKDLK